MKELTIEQKAKAYDEALKRAVVAHKDEDRHLKAALERIFPELKESEDEKIRKYLIERIISAYGENSSTPEGIKVKNIINWLEKRKRLYSDYEESELRRGLLWHLKELQNIEKSKGLPIKAKATYESWISWLEKQGEQKPTDKVEDEEYNGEDYGIDSLFHAQRILEKTLGKVDGYQTDDGILAHQCAITAVKKLYEHKPAEWSEEDETRLTNIIIMLKEGASRHFIKDDITKAIDWLKSLKPQNHWKPTEPQLVSLTIACDRKDRVGFELTQLLKELKKL